MSVGKWSTFHTPYSESNVYKVVPSSSGVYALWIKYKSGIWKCFYVSFADIEAFPNTTLIFDPKSINS